MSAFCSRVIFSNSLTFFQIPTSPSHRPPPLMTLPWDPVAGDPSAALDRALPIGGTPGDRPIKPSDGGRGPREGSNACSCVSTFVCPPCGAPSLSCLYPSPAVPESRLESPGEGGGLSSPPTRVLVQRFAGRSASSPRRELPSPWGNPFQYSLAESSRNSFSPSVGHPPSPHV